MNEPHDPSERPLPSVPPSVPSAASQPPAPPQPPRRDKRWWWRATAVAAAALAVIGASVGVGMAMTATNSASDDTSMSSPSPSPATQAVGKHAKKGKKADKKDKPDPARRAWAHKYGVDRSTMPNLAPVTSATPEQQQTAAALLQATENATQKYDDVNVAHAAGYDLQAALTKAEQKRPHLAALLQSIDTGTMPKHGKMPMLHVANPGNRQDGKVLDPSAPETLMYEYTGKDNWKLIGVMYTAGESYPQAPPDPGGPIMRWHYHDKSGGQGLMMHLFFIPGSDLAHAYAAEMS